MNTTIERPDGINLCVVYTDSNTHDDMTCTPFILVLIIIIIVCILFLRGRTHMHPFSADALGSRLVVDHAIATIAPAPGHVVHEHVLRVAQVDMLHVMRGDGVTDRASG